MDTDTDNEGRDAGDQYHRQLCFAYSDAPGSCPEEVFLPG